YMIQKIMYRLGQWIVPIIDHAIGRKPEFLCDTDARLILAIVEDAGRNTARRAPRRDISDDPRIRADLGLVADDYRSQDLGPGPGNDAVAQGRMAFSLIPRSSAKRYAVVEGDIVADLRGFADDDAHTVIDKKPPPDDSSWMDLDASQKTGDVRDEPPRPFQIPLPQPMRQPMQRARVEAGVAGNHLPRGA